MPHELKINRAARRAYLDGGNTGHLHPAGAAPFIEGRMKDANEMNDLERRLCWHEVRAYLGMQHEDDWPASLPVLSIAWLKNQSRKDGYSAFLSLLQSEIAAGHLPQNGEPLTRTKTSSERVFMGISLTHGGAERWENVSRTKTETISTVRAEDAARLLNGMELGKCLDAWLSPYQHKSKATPGAGETGDRKPDEQVARDESPGELLERILVDCERRASAAGVPFSVDDMPGQIAQFWELCKRLDAVFKRQKTIDSFKRYTKAGRCKWSNSAKANPDATPLYQKLFPEAWPNGGAAAEKSQKA